MDLSRRTFMGVAIGSSLPGIFRTAAWAAPASNQAGGEQTVLVLLQLTGGNDGLNTVIPFRDHDYLMARPQLKQPASQVLKLNEDLALHPKAKGLSELFQSQQLALIQGVGYPQPNRSHFESMDLWHTTTTDRNEKYGWLGKAAPKLGAAGVCLQIGDDTAPLCLTGSTGPAPALQSLKEYQLKVAENGDAPKKRQVIESLAGANTAKSGSLAELLRKNAQETYRSAASLRDVSQKAMSNTSFPSTGLGTRLKLISSLIAAGVSERIYFTSLGGFDTHAEQLPAHGRLMDELAGSLAAFQADLKATGQARRVVTLVYSEFGRRVKENGSAGTDHGAAGPVFLIGEGVQPGIHGAHPSLTDLDDGDLKFHTDFRSIYAALLDDWLKVPSPGIIQGTYPKLSLVKSA